MNHKIPFHELSSRIASATGISEESAEIFAKNFFDLISEELINGETIKVKGLGEFSLQDENGEKNVKYTPDKELAEALNAPFAMFEPTPLNDEVSNSMLDAVNEIDDQTTGTDDQSETIIENTEELSDQGDSVSTDEIISTQEKQKEDNISETQYIEPIKNQESIKDGINQEDSKTTSAKDQTEETIQLPLQEEDKSKKCPLTPEVESPIKPIAEKPIAPVIQPLEEEPEIFIAQNTQSSTNSNLWLGLIIGFIVGLAIGACGVYLAIDHLFPGGRAQVTNNEIVEEIVESPMDIATDSATIVPESNADIVTAEVIQEPIPAKEISEPKVRKDTVRRGYLIPSMAKKFFGSKDYWVYIYEENKSKIGNPNNIQPGVVLDIPAPEKYGIIPGNEESLKRAKQKASEILAKYPR